MTESVNVLWNAKKPSPVITDLLSQLPPSLKADISNKFSIANFTSSNNSSYLRDARYLNHGLHAIYIPEYNDLLICSRFNYYINSTYEGFRILIFHDFISNYTGEPHINPANMNTFDLPHPTISGTTAGKQLITWQHGYLWFIHGDYAVAAANTEHKLTIRRYRYDGIKFTLVQTLSSVNSGCFNVNQYNAWSDDLSLLPNNLISVSTSNATKIGVVKLVYDVSNDTYTTERGSISYTNVSTNPDTSTQNFLTDRLSCFYFAQSKKWIYYIYGNSNRVEICFNTNADESSFTALMNSLNVQANWHEAAQGYMIRNHNFGIGTITTRDNRTIVFERTQAPHNICFADSIEQLEMTKPWHWLSSNASTGNGLILTTPNRLVLLEVDQSNDIIDNDWAIFGSTNDYPPTFENTRERLATWTEDGKTFYASNISTGSTFVLPFNNMSIDSMDDYTYELMIMNRYLIAFIDDETNKTSSSNQYAKLAVIDIEKRL